MLSHCANPQCSKPFVRLGEGRLFLVETEGSLPGEFPVLLAPYARHPLRRVERYWLCDQCARVWTLVQEHVQEHGQEPGQRMVLVALPRPPASSGLTTAKEIGRTA